MVKPNTLKSLGRLSGIGTLGGGSGVDHALAILGYSRQLKTGANRTLRGRSDREEIRLPYCERDSLGPSKTASVTAE